MLKSSELSIYLTKAHSGAARVKPGWNCGHADIRRDRRSGRQAQNTDWPRIGCRGRSLAPSFGRFRLQPPETSQLTHHREDRSLTLWPEPGEQALNLSHVPRPSRRLGDWVLRLIARKQI